MVCQPIRGHRISLDALRIELRGDFQPGQNLALLAAVKMRVLRDHEMTPHPFDPISGWPEEILLFFMLFLVAGVMFRVMVLLDVAALALPLVKDRWVVAAVEIAVRFPGEMLGEQPPPVTQKDPQQIVPSLLAPNRGVRLQNGGQR